MSLKYILFLNAIFLQILATMDGEIRDLEIQKWCNETLEKGGKSSRVNNFKEKDLALAVIDICDILSPGSVDYS